MSRQSDCQKEDSARKRRRQNPPKVYFQQNDSDENGDENDNFDVETWQDGTNVPLDVIKSVVEGSRTQVLDSNEVCEMLSECSFIYLRKAIEIASNHMRRGERTELTVADFNLGLNVITRCKSLRSFAPACKAGHVNLTGVSRDKDKTEKSASSAFKLRISGGWYNDNPFTRCVSDLPVEQQEYFKALTKALLSSRKELYLPALTDLKTNQNILHLVPYFVNFLSIETDKMRRCYPDVTVLLKAMQSLLSNPHFECHTYVSEMANPLLKCLLDPSPNVKFNSANWSMREKAADVLARILKIRRSKKLCFEVLSKLESAFSSLRKESALNNLENLVCHYGVIVTVNFVGVFAIVLILPQHIEKYIEHLNFIELADYHKRIGSCMIRGQLIHSYYLLICHFLKNEFKGFCGSDVLPKLSLLRHYPLDLSWKTEVFPIILGIPFAEYFGDALVQYFPLLSFVSYNQRTGRKNKFKQSLRKKNVVKLSAKSLSLENTVSNKGSIYVQKNYQSYSCKKPDKDRASQNSYKNPVKLHSVFDTVPLISRTFKFAKIKKTV